MTTQGPEVVAGDRVLVIIPTYEEALNIEHVVARLRDAVPAADVLVVDDASPDGTGAIAARLATQSPKVHVLHRLGKQGLGTAYLDGFGWGLARDYDVLVEMDADGSHQPEQLPDLLVALDHADVVIGSRWVRGGSVLNWPRSRMLLSRVGNTYVRVALGLPVRDATGGFRAYKRATLDRLDLHGVASHGYCFQIDLTRRAIGQGCVVTEVPIEFVERVQGSSKMTGSIVCEALWRVTVWGMRRWLARGSAALSPRGR